MKLTHYQYFKPIEAMSNKSKTLVIENPVYYRNMIDDLFSQKESGIGEFVLSDEKNKIYDINKNCLLISDFFNFIAMEKQIKTKLANMIVNSYQSKIEIVDLMTLINEIGVGISNDFMYPIKFKELLTFQDVVKMLDFSLDFDGLGFWEKFIEYIKTCFELFDYKLLITIGLKEVISPDEYFLVMEDLQNRNIPVLMIERHAHSEMDDVLDTILIDKDLCVL